MEIMEAPELPPGFGTILPRTDGVPGCDADRVDAPLPEDVIGNVSPEQRQASVTPQPVPEGVARKAQAQRRRRKVQVDTPDSVLISGEVSTCTGAGRWALQRDAQHGHECCP